jgi:hypothetical protein
VTGLLLRVSAEDHRALYAHDLTGGHGGDVRGALDPTDPPTRCSVVATDASAPGHDRVREPGKRARAGRAANLADAVRVSWVTWTSAQQIAADVPERH